MELEYRTRKYLIVGSIFLLATVMIQEAPQAKDTVEDELFGDYITDNSPDMVLPNAPNYSSISYTSTDSPFSYSGHYVPENRFLKGNNTSGIIMLRAKNENFLIKRYSQIPEGSEIIVRAYNDVYLTPELNTSKYCESLNASISVDDKTSERFQVSKINSTEKYSFDAPETKKSTELRLDISPSKKCGDMSQQLGVDRFYLKVPEEKIPDGVVGRLLYRLNL